MAIVIVAMAEDQTVLHPDQCLPKRPTEIGDDLLEEERERSGWVTDIEGSRGSQDPLHRSQSRTQQAIESVCLVVGNGQGVCGLANIVDAVRRISPKTGC